MYQLNTSRLLVLVIVIDEPKNMWLTLFCSVSHIEATRFSWPLVRLVCWRMEGIQDLSRPRELEVDFIPYKSPHPLNPLNSRLTKQGLRPTLAARNPGGIPAFSSGKKPTRRFSTGRDTCPFGSPPLAPLGPVGAGFSWGYISGLLTPGDIPRVVSAPRDLDSTSSFDAARPSSPLLGRRPSVLASPPTPPLRPRLSSDAAPPSSRLLRRHRPCGSSTSVSTGLGAADGRIFLPPPVHPLVQLFIRRSLIRPCQFNHCSVTGRPRPKIRALGDV
ncbi:hypothetical protein BDA96_04G323500 [Sorghum bicolor]|uniref:Uncharacterized protein n=1 Tax=Sorghum bicolor TaxID=4558 RepID=A0A921R7E3_SORBI|nr:hypothetical protein BDA96_04G323500 [Sorghum bicolor]